MHKRVDRGARIGLAFDDGCPAHAPPSPNHPERPERVRVAFERLRTTSLLEKLIRLATEEASLDDLRLCHSEEHLAALEELESRRPIASSLPSSWPTDLYASEATPTAARLAVGGVLACLKALLDGECDVSFALVRPPSHHCDGEAPSGFCFLNGTALAACKAAQDLSKRVFILDWDVHFGNGTFDIVRSRENIYFLSLHRYENGSFYPHRGSLLTDDTGARCICVPWQERGLGNAEYELALQTIILPVLTEVQPDVIVISAGFDAAEGDPLGGMQVSPTWFGHALRQIRSARDCPVLLALEGGYNPRVVADCVEECVRAALGQSVPAPLSFSELCPSAITVLRDVANVHARWFSCLRSWDETSQVFRAEMEKKQVQDRRETASARVPDTAFTIPPALRARLEARRRTRT